MNKLSASLRIISPPLWQYPKYSQHMLSKDAEREIHFVGRSISVERAAAGIGGHLGFYTRHFTGFAKSVIASAKLAHTVFGKSVRMNGAEMHPVGGFRHDGLQSRKAGRSCINDFFFVP